MDRVVTEKSCNVQKRQNVCLSLICFYEIENVQPFIIKARIKNSFTFPWQNIVTDVITLREMCSPVVCKMHA